MLEKEDRLIDDVDKLDKEDWLDEEFIELIELIDVKLLFVVSELDILSPSDFFYADW